MSHKLQNFINQGKEKSEELFAKMKHLKHHTRLALIGVLAGGALLFAVKQCDNQNDHDKEKTELTFSKNPYWQGEGRDAKIIDFHKEQLAP